METILIPALVKRLPMEAVQREWTDLQPRVLSRDDVAPILTVIELHRALEMSLGPEQEAKRQKAEWSSCAAYRVQWALTRQDAQINLTILLVRCCLRTALCAFRSGDNNA
jgi:hypothetical protein